MTFTINAALLQPIVALIAGILILLIPRILNFIVAIYLIFVGVTGLWPLTFYPPFRTERDAASWLWSSVVELVASHEAAYLDHCRKYAMESNASA